MPALFASPRPAVTRPGQRLCALIIDAEEDFDWKLPVRDTWHDTEYMLHLGVLHQILAAYEIVPAYLVTYPVLEDDGVVGVLRRFLESGRCVLGVQLHTWVTPPFDEGPSHKQSFSGNLDPALEERKLLSLRAKFVERFGHAPLVFRSGRYGLSHGTARLLEDFGFTVDTSVAPRTNFAGEGGPDYRAFDDRPFWFGRDRDLLELPLCRNVVGRSGRFAPRAYEAVSRVARRRALPMSLLARSRLAERITLSPEGNDFDAMRRLVDRSVARGQRLLSVSFHSSSLYPGHNPYVRSRRDLHIFYDRLSAILDYMTGAMSFTFAPVDRIPHMIEPPARTDRARSA